MDANHPLRILIVEDVPSDAELAERELRNSGFQFTSVRVDTKEGFLKALDEYQPHLVISDYAMPEFDGMQALMLALEHDAKLPFIVLTGSMNEETAVDCMKAGATDYVIKDRLARLPFAVREALEIKKNLLEKEASEKELAESEARFRCLLQSVPNVAVQGYGPDGTIQYWNQASESLYGYTAQEAIGRNLVDLIIPPEMRGDVEQAIQQMVETRHPIPSSELFLMRKDGSRVAVISSHAVIQVPGREPELFCIDIDLTERKRAEEALQASSDEIKTISHQLIQAEKLATMGELAASIAHELNNPLATVSLRIESLLEKTPENSPDRRELNIIEQEITRMSNLIANLLQFSRRSRPQISTVNICEEIEKTIDLIYYQLRKHNISIMRQFARDAPQIHADRQQLRQLFLNLFTNAVDAMPRGGILTIIVAVNAEEKQVKVEIADTGAGIMPDVLKKVMDPFFTTKPEGKGTGLGLAICRRIAQEHQGTIEITSDATPGKGTRVSLTLPVRDSSSVDYLCE